jgi:5-methylcytosine-specific restriction endonuclease McrA
MTHHIPLTGGKGYRQSIEVKTLIRERDNHTCQICGKPGHDVDHIIPWKESHDSTLGNLRVLCHSCNMKRHPLRRPLLNTWYESIEAELVTAQ